MAEGMEKKGIEPSAQDFLEAEKELEEIGNENVFLSENPDGRVFYTWGEQAVAAKEKHPEWFKGFILSTDPRAKELLAKIMKGRTAKEVESVISPWVPKEGEEALPGAYYE